MECAAFRDDEEEAVIGEVLTSLEKKVGRPLV